jgi:hypothetical protein
MLQYEICFNVHIHYLYYIIKAYINKTEEHAANFYPRSTSRASELFTIVQNLKIIPYSEDTQYLHDV